MYTNKYIEYLPNKPPTTSMQDNQVSECKINNTVAIEFSRRQEREASASRTFVRLMSLDYGKAK